MIQRCPRGGGGDARDVRAAKGLGVQLRLPVQELLGHLRGHEHRPYQVDHRRVAGPQQHQQDDRGITADDEPPGGSDQPGGHARL
jgi:hypothetical protein